MGQGPNSPVYLFIGNGRLSRHLQHYFRSLSLPFHVWTRHAEQPLADALPGCSHVLLAIPDDALEPFLADHDLRGRRVIHFSGSLSLERGWGAHPLMTFAPNLYPLEEYRRIHFVVDADAPDFAELLPGLPNRHHRLERQDKALYHALCVISGNFTTILWKRFFEALEERLGLPGEAALPYLRRVAANLKQSDQPLTGPLARGDRGTVQRNLQALQGDPLGGVYSSFVEAYAPGLSS